MGIEIISFIFYRYSPGDSLISIGSTSGSVFLAQSLDFSLSSNSTVLAHCQDRGVPPLSDTTQVTVIVNPVISFEQATYTTDLPDNSGVGTFIATVSLCIFAKLRNIYISYRFLSLIKLGSFQSHFRYLLILVMVLLLLTVRLGC